MSTAPIAKKVPHEIELHGIKRQDPYAWLKAANWQDVMQDPSVLDAGIKTWLDEENAHTETFFADQTGLQESLFNELKGRIKEDDSTVPLKDGAYRYFNSFEPGQQYPQFYRVKSGEAFDAGDTGVEREIVFDANAAAEDQSYFSLGGLTHSPDHKLVAAGVDTKGSEYHDLEIREIKTGKVLETLDQVSGDMVWCEGSKAILYTTLDENHRPSTVMYHRLGTDMSEDTQFFHEADPGFFVSLGQSESNDYIFIEVFQHDTSEVYVLKTDEPRPAEKPVRKREAGIEYSLHHHGKQFLIRTNLDGATNFKIMTAQVDDPAPDSWRDLIAASDTATIVSLMVFRDYMARIVRKRALPQIIITRFDDGEEHGIAFDEEAFSLGLHGSYEYDTDTLRFSYSSPTSPGQVFDYNMETRARSLRKTQEIPSGHASTDYITRRFFAKAADGAEVPVTLLAHRDTPLDGSAPTLLYGYGSYGSSMPAGFSTGILSLVQRGFVYAIGHVRGGSEMGESWYKDGRHKTKLNTFTDFICVAEDLIRRNFAAKGEIAIQGGSAGGMLVGAVVNMRPDLFKAVVAEVPFVDVLTTMSDLDLPLTPIEWPEWGNPIESREDYELIASYSPVDNVEAKDYPAIFAIGGLTDPRVTYWEPAKWIATLREHNTSANPLLLKTNMEAGHGGASGRFDRLKETAQVYAFLLKIFGKV